MVGPAAKREAVAHLQPTYEPVRAAGLLDRRRRPQDDPLSIVPAAGYRTASRLRELANERRRFGYRRLFVLLRRRASRPGSTASTGSIARKASQCASARARRRAVGAGADPGRGRPNARWSLDFVHDQFANGGASASSTSSTT